MDHSRKQATEQAASVYFSPANNHCDRTAEGDAQAGLGWYHHSNKVT